MRQVLSVNTHEQPSLRQMAARPNWEKVVKAIEDLEGESWEKFQIR
jgi:hypothetical protein